MTEKVTLPSMPMTEQQQTQTLQKMGLDFLSSIHWVIIIIIAVLFAGLLVFVKRRKDAVKAKEAEENDLIIQKSAKELEEIYLDANDELRPNVIPKPQRPRAGAEVHADDAQCTTFAEDGINKRINTALSPNILQQLRRFAKSGGLFSFLNSTLSAKETMQKQMLGAVTKQPLPTEEQKIAMSLRSRYGADQLRNPLINSQIRNEILHRREEQEKETVGQGNLDQQQLSTLEKAFTQN